MYPSFLCLLQVDQGMDTDGGRDVGTGRQGREAGTKQSWRMEVARERGRRAGLGRKDEEEG